MVDTKLVTLKEEFQSFEELEAAIESYSKINNCRFVTVDKISVQSYNSSNNFFINIFCG